jgi:hypothetical protein
VRNKTDPFSSPSTPQSRSISKDHGSLRTTREEHATSAGGAPAHSAYSRIAGYEDVNDAERASQDPTLRLIGSEKTWDRGAALTFRLQTFETEMLAGEENFRSLARIKRELIGKANAIDAPQRIVLDMDSTKIPVYLLSPAAAVQ